jgi:hypothetical protein
VTSDGDGRIKVDGIVPGLKYRMHKDATVRNRLPGGGFLVNKDAVDKDMVLAP